jgi:hypothetical protein
MRRIELLNRGSGRILSSIGLEPNPQAGTVFVSILQRLERFLFIVKTAKQF